MNTKSVAQNKRLFKICLLALSALVFAGCKAADPKVKKIKSPSNGSPGGAISSTKISFPIASSPGAIASGDGVHKVSFVVGLNVNNGGAASGSNKAKITTPGVARGQ